ncbi:MAG: GNAT family N-acetyltransferase [Tumebacillaceae bacterium]
MSKVYKMEVNDVDSFIRLASNSYPSFQLTSQDAFDRTVQRFQQKHQEEAQTEFYGLEREGQVLGCYLSHSYRMNLLGTRTNAAGIGFVAVDFMHKKEAIAKDLLQAFHRQSREKGYPITLLYPFRPDFYKQMGYGFGTKMNQYRLLPSAFPKGKSKKHVQLLTRDDKQLYVDCYTRFMEKHHGMIEKNPSEVNPIFDNLHQLKVVGFKKDGKVEGYLVFFFKTGVHDENLAMHNMVIREFVYETPEALSELMTFLNSQADQVNRIIFHTQDEFFHHLFTDPRNTSGRVIPHVYHESNVQGIGLMYRVVDTVGVFTALQGHNFGGQTVKVKLTIADTFLPENAGSTILHVAEGIATVKPDGNYDVEVKLDISDFSSLLMGSIHFKALYNYGLAEISDAAYVDTIYKLFFTEEKPLCTTGF